ncbi:MAG: CYTH domain-containing protein [Bacteroidetes bacterium]|nr:MAG: CYTH domain-containing protein [Bacteroidota bacterium]
MPTEIERKFLVKGKFKNEAVHSFEIKQGYLNSAPERSVRIRITGKEAFLTIKGLGNDSGMSRYEWEISIDKKEALDLLKICEPGLIEKTRYVIPVGHHEFEVDEFYGENEGLFLAEIELAHESESFQKPEWLGEEVTGIEKYYNIMLMKHPYRQWDS